MNTRRLDQLIQRWRVVTAGLPDCRTGENCSYTMADIALSAFAVFFITIGMASKVLKKKANEKGASWRGGGPNEVVFWGDQK